MNSIVYNLFPTAASPNSCGKFLVQLELRERCWHCISNRTNTLRAKPKPVQQSQRKISVAASWYNSASCASWLIWSSAHARLLHRRPDPRPYLWRMLHRQLQSPIHLPQGRLVRHTAVVSKASTRLFCNPSKPQTLLRLLNEEWNTALQVFLILFIAK